MALDSTLPVNRDKKCPMMVRCFWGLERHREPQDFAQLGHPPAKTNEIQIHT